MGTLMPSDILICRDINHLKYFDIEKISDPNFAVIFGNDRNLRYNLIVSYVCNNSFQANNFFTASAFVRNNNLSLLYIISKL